MDRYCVWLTRAWLSGLLCIITHGFMFTRSCSRHTSNTNYCVVTICVILTVYCTNLAALHSDLCQNDTISLPPHVVLIYENISLICNSNSYNSADMYFMRGRDRLLGYTEILNTSAIKINYPATSDLVENFSRLNFKCAIDLNGTSTCIGNRRVPIDYYPVRATNIECRIYNWEYMRCWWDLGIEYNHPNYVSVVCDYASTENYTTDFLSKEVSDNFWRVCPLLNRTSCTWDRNNFMDPYKQFHLLINITNTQRPEASVSVHKTFITDDITQIAAVPRDAIDISEIDGPHCLIIRWPAACKYKKILYNLGYKSTCSNYSSIGVKYTTIDGLAGTKICDINIYSVYEFSIKGVFISIIGGNVEIKGHWSNETFFSYTTKKEVPSRSPYVIPGLYEHMVDSEHNAKAYWKALGTCDLHSNKDSVNYIVSVDNNSTHIKAVEHPVFYTKLEVPDDKVVTVSIQTRNDKGKSKAISQINIYPKHSGLYASSLTINIPKSGKGLVHATIEKLHDMALNHTIVWCKGSAYCEDQIYWQRLPLGVLETKLAVTKEYRFGLITEFELLGVSYNTGILWEECLYDEGKVPVAAPRGVHRSDVQLPESFRLEWRHHECTEGYFNYYLLTYCVSEEEPSCTCKGKETRIKIPKQETSFTVREIPAGSYVCAWLNVVSTGIDGPQSSQVLFEIQKKAFSSWIWIGPLLACIVFVGVVIMLVFMWRRFKRRLQGMTEIQEVRLDDATRSPFFEDTTLLNDGEGEDSEDSGRSSMPQMDTPGSGNHQSGHIGDTTARFYDVVQTGNTGEGHNHLENPSDHSDSADQSEQSRYNQSENIHTVTMVGNKESVDHLASGQLVHEESICIQSEPGNDTYMCSNSGSGIGSYQTAALFSLGDSGDISSYSKLGSQTENSNGSEEQINSNNSFIDSNNEETQTLLPTGGITKSILITDTECDISTPICKHLKLKEPVVLSDIDEDEATNMEYDLQDISDILDV